MVELNLPPSKNPHTLWFLRPLDQSRWFLHHAAKHNIRISSYICTIVQFDYHCASFKSLPPFSLREFEKLPSWIKFIMPLSDGPSIPYPTIIIIIINHHCFYIILSVLAFIICWQTFPGSPHFFKKRSWECQLKPSLEKKWHNVYLLLQIRHAIQRIELVQKFFFSKWIFFFFFYYYIIREHLGLIFFLVETNSISIIFYN